MEIGAAAAVAFKDAPQQRCELELELAGLAAGLPEVPDDHPDVDGVVLDPGTPEPVDVVVVDSGMCGYGLSRCVKKGPLAYLAVKRPRSTEKTLVERELHRVNTDLATHCVKLLL